MPPEHSALSARITELLNDAGLREDNSKDEGGGFRVRPLKDASVRVDWSGHDRIMAPGTYQEPWPANAAHPVVPMDYRASTRLLVAMAELLFSCGYTVTLCPEFTDDEVAHLRVTAGPYRERA